MAAHSKETISIIIPFYNSQRFLKECLESLVNQTFKDFVAYLIDDGSKDESSNIALSYCEKFKDNFVYLRQDNAGQGSARNNGLEHAKGKFVFFLDSDDFLGTHALEKLVANINDQLDALFFNPTIFDMSSKEYVEWYDSNYVKKMFSEHKILSCSECNDLLGTEISINRCLWNREFLVKNDFKYPTDTKWEDIPPHYFIVHEIKKCSFIDGGYFYYYRVNSGNQTTSKISKTCSDIIKVFDAVLEKAYREKWTKREISNVVRFINMYSRWAVSQLDGERKLDFINQVHSFYKKVKYKHLFYVRKLKLFNISKKEYFYGFFMKSWFLNKLYKGSFIIKLKKLLRKLRLL